MTVYENLKGMLQDAEEIRAMAEANGDAEREALWARKVEQHRAKLARYDEARRA